MSDFAHGFVWGFFSAGPVVIAVVGLLHASGQASEAERERRRGYEGPEESVPPTPMQKPKVRGRRE